MRFARLLCTSRRFEIDVSLGIADSRGHANALILERQMTETVERDTAIYFANYFGESIFAHLLWGPVLSALHTMHDARRLMMSLTRARAEIEASIAKLRRPGPDTLPE